MKQEEIKNTIRNIAESVGFTACGFAPAGKLSEDAARLREWLDKGMHAGMDYMQNYFDLRTHPAKLVPGAKTVIVVLLNYFPEQALPEETYKIARYAYGRDYHKVMKKMLREFHAQINEQVIPVSGRVFVDSAPVLERSLAALAGLGWVGKNANLISPKHGSYVFIGELICDIELLPDKPLPDYCGGCTKCVQACPTGAIVAPAKIDSNKCIPYWTIEHKGEIDPALKDKFQQWIFGCDICQEVCPWNRKSKSTHIEDFKPKPDLLAMAKEDWKVLTEEKFNELFRGSAVKRTKFEGLVRNIHIVSQHE